MLTGKELGSAIKAAIEKKLALGQVKSKAEIARHFGVQPPSIHDWMKKGSIEKDKLPELWRFFADVVGPDHWGLHEWPNNGTTHRSRSPVLDTHEKEAPGAWHQYQSATPGTRAAIELLLIPEADRITLPADARAAILLIESVAVKAVTKMKSKRPSAA